MGKLWCRDHRGKEYDFSGFMEYARDFHGHPAPGLMLGGAMVEGARQKLAPDCLFDVVCETRSCLPDAVQLLTLCTIGNGWLKIIDSGRFALTLYDKRGGEGVRVSIDPAKLPSWPELKCWLLKEKPKAKQDSEKLYEEIEGGGADVIKFENVSVDLERMKKVRGGRIVFCPDCGEPFPEALGGQCPFCAGDRYFK